MASEAEDIDGVLRATPVFQQLTPEDRRKVAGAASVRRYSRSDGWGKERLVQTAKDGFVILDRQALESVAAD